jgi:hypothetical protein
VVFVLLYHLPRVFGCRLVAAFSSLKLDFSEIVRLR